jgi:hypothetical protein
MVAQVTPIARHRLEGGSFSDLEFLKKDGVVVGKRRK